MDCKKATREIVAQIELLLNNLDTSTYRKPLPIFNGSSLGQHFRHIFDFYNCLFCGIDQGVIDYALRERNPQIERDPKSAISAFQKIVNRCNALEEVQSLNVKADFKNYTAEERPTLQSSIGREMMYAYDHALHHLAIIKIGIQTAFPQILMDEHLGVAPATIKYRAGQQAPER